MKKRSKNKSKKKHTESARRRELEPQMQEYERPPETGLGQKTQWFYLGGGVLVILMAVVVWFIITQSGEDAGPIGSSPRGKWLEQATEPGANRPAEMPEPSLQSPIVDSPKSSSLAAPDARVSRDRLKSGGEGPEMVTVAAGSFRMGDIEGRDKAAQPVHTVTLKKPFAIGRYEVTFDEYDRFAQATGRELPNDGGGGRGRQPVINFSWDDAVEYASWLSAQAGKRYRLPTEAEWEYAARGGKETTYWWGNQMKSGVANCIGCGSPWDNKMTAPVGSFQANPFGLYDTAGNLWEWVEDCDHENYKDAPTDGSAWKKEGNGNCYLRVFRGGAWNYEAKGLRSSFRGRGDPANKSATIGFRLVRESD
ncbi:MAG: formylglycine-generating enzyme family protein [Candidatus Binatia bacterium]